MAVETPAPLVVAGFGRRYSRRAPWAVRNLQATLAPGTITALVGPNGAGKSTFVRACVGFEPPDEGRIEVDGHDVVRSRREAVAAVGYVPQATSLYRNLTISDHLAMARAARPRFDGAYARALIDDAGLNRRRRVGQLSGGEQARVAVALALGSNATLLLLDEPLASLDPLARREVMTSLVTDVRRRGATALLASHVITDIEQGADRVMVIANGALLLDAPVRNTATEFRTMPAAAANGNAIGVFAGPDGTQLALVRAGARPSSDTRPDETSAGHPASLEEIVLGHLAKVRGGSSE